MIQTDRQTDSECKTEDSIETRSEKGGSGKQELLHLGGRNKFFYLFFVYELKNCFQSTTVALLTRTKSRQYLAGTILVCTSIGRERILLRLDGIKLRVVRKLKLHLSSKLARSSFLSSNVLTSKRYRKRPSVPSNVFTALPSSDTRRKRWALVQSRRSRQLPRYAATSLCSHSVNPKANREKMTQLT